MSADRTPELVRHAYLPDCTLGWLHMGSLSLATIERPWVPDDHPGGRNSESCIPDGLYDLRHHNSDKFPNVFALTAAEHGVYYMPADRPGGIGRFAILIHVANRASEVEGCIAVGLQHGTIGGEEAVLNSRKAMHRLRDTWATLPPQLRIRPTTGTAEAG